MHRRPTNPIGMERPSFSRSWLAEQLKLNELREPDGRPLYALQVRREDYELLGSELRRLAGSLALERPTESLGACFCIYVAEWWRREFPGGAWNWYAPAASIAWEYLPYNTLLRLTESGLGYWRRPIHQHEVQRAYLGTLAREGGLPMRLIREGAPLRRYLRLLMQDLETFGASKGDLLVRFAAERGETYLPRSFQSPGIYELAAALARFAWEFDDPGTERSPAALRTTLLGARSEWRRKLPLSLEEDAALELLATLLNEAKVVRTGGDRSLRIRTSLRLQGGAEPVLTSELTAPVGCEVTHVQAMLGDQALSPWRFDLFTASDDGASQMLASFAKYGDRYRITIPRAARSFLRPFHGVRNLQLWTTVDGRVLPIDIPGCDALDSDLPWVFVPRLGEPEEGLWDLAAQGSLRTAHPRVLVAVPEWASLSTGEGALLEPAEVRLHDRTLHFVTGVAIIRREDARFTIRTKAPVTEDTAGHYVLVGTPWSVDPEVHADPPAVRRVRPDGTVLHIPTSELSWRPSKGRGEWQPLNQGRRPLGEVRIRHEVRGETFAVLRASVAPPKAQVSLRPRNGKGGSLEVSGFGDGAIGILGTHPAGIAYERKATPIGSGVRLEVVATSSQVPAAVVVEVRWSHHIALTFRVPFPVSGSRFIGRDGAELPSSPRGPEPSVTLNRLGGVIAEGRSHAAGGTFQLRATLDSFDAACDSSMWGTSDRDLVTQADRVTHRIDLGAVRPEVARLFAFSDDISATVRLRIDGGQGWAPRLVVKRFPGQVAFDDEVGMYRAEATDPGVPTADRLEAVSLEDPAERFALLRDEGSGRWRVPDEVTAGMWLIFAFAGEWAGWRPRVLAVPGADETDDELLGAIREKSPVKRAERFEGVVAAMVKNPEHPGWQRFDAYLPAVRDVPAMVFDLIRCVARSPEAAVTAIFRAEQAQQAQLWEMFESLGVVWETVPVATWVKVAVRSLEAAAEIAQHVPPTLREELMRDAVRAIESEESEPRRRLPSLFLAHALLEHLVRGRKTTESQKLLGELEPPADQALLQLRHAAEVRLGQNMANAQWPTWVHFEAQKQRLALPAALRALLIQPDQEHKDLVLNTPILAAIAAATGQSLPVAMRFRVRAIAEAYRDWFSEAYDHTLPVALRIALSSPEYRTHLELP